MTGTRDLAARFRLDGRVALVTGAGRGIGRAIALAFAAAGADIAVTARTQADLDAVAAEARALGRRAVVLPADISQAGAAEAVVQGCVGGLGRLDVLVNNAGGAGPNDPLRTTPEQFLKTLGWNVLPAYALTRLAVPHLRVGGGGSVINITSAAARYAQRSFSSYGTAKAALTQLTRLLAQDFAPAIRVNAIAPGPVVTEALERFLTPEVRAAMETRTPLGRLGTVEDIACATVFLASPASSWMTGKTLELDGGAEATVWPL